MGLGGNADAGIIDRDAQCRGLRVLFGRRNRDHDFAALGELDRIVDEIGEYLPQPHRVAAQAARHLRIDRAGDFEPLGLGALAKQLDHVLDRLDQVEDDLLEIDLAGLDLGKIEDLVDDFEQVLGRTLDCLGKPRLVVVQPALQQQFVHAHDAVHRRADLVAHVGEELGFRHAGRFRDLLGMAHFARSFLDGFLKGVLVRAQRLVAGLDFAQHVVERDCQHAEFVAAALLHAQREVLVARDLPGGFDQVE